ncbi:MAG: acyltransferase family protein, partial [Actinomycetota bacterium]|nr:acyltransferase family protein [Actinomycetota bacterium]
MSLRQGPEWTPDGRVWFAQALRGPACLLVVFAHFGHIFLFEQATVGAVALFPPLSGLPRPPWASVIEVLDRLHVSTGHVGVFVFFLVSGFVIPYSLADRRLGGFFVRRFFRLYPALWACLAVTVTVLVVHLDFLGYALPYDAAAVAGDALLVSPYLGSRWIEPVLWTLAVEELFYLVAALVAWRGRLADGRVVAVVAGFLTAVALVAGTEQRPETARFWVGFNATFVLFILIGLVVHQRFRGRWGLGASTAGAALLAACYAVALYRGPAAPQATVYLVSSAVGASAFAALYLLRRRLRYLRTLDM